MLPGYTLIRDKVGLGLQGTTLIKFEAPFPVYIHDYAIGFREYLYALKFHFEGNQGERREMKLRMTIMESRLNVDY